MKKLLTIILSFMLITSQDAFCLRPMSASRGLSQKQQADFEKSRKKLEQVAGKTRNIETIRNIKEAVIEALSKGSQVVVVIDGQERVGKTIFSRRLFKWLYSVTKEEILLIERDFWPTITDIEDLKAFYPEKRLIIIEGVMASEIPPQDSHDIRILVDADEKTRSPKRFFESTSYHADEVSFWGIFENRYKW